MLHRLAPLELPTAGVLCASPFFVIVVLVNRDAFYITSTKKQFEIFLVIEEISFW